MRSISCGEFRTRRLHRRRLAIAQLRGPLPPGHAVRARRSTPRTTRSRRASRRPTARKAAILTCIDLRAARIRSMNAGLPARSERTQYGEPSAPTGPSGSNCQTVKPAWASQSMNARPPRPSAASQRAQVQQHARPAAIENRQPQVTVNSALRAPHDAAVLRRAAPDRDGLRQALGRLDVAACDRARPAGGDTADRTGSPLAAGCNHRTTRTSPSSRTARAGAPRRRAARPSSAPDSRSNTSLASHSRSQAAFLSGSPIQVASVPCTQLPATTCRQRPRFEPARDALGQRGQLELRMRGELRVQRPQEVVAVERIVLPGVLAIERDQHCVAGLAGEPARQLRQLVDEIARGIIAVPGRVGEADAIGQACRRGRSSACCEPAQRRIGFERRTASGTLARNTLALDAIQLKPGVVEQLERAAADRAFRRPAACRLRAERVREDSQPMLNVPGRALGAARISRSDAAARRPASPRARN